MELFIKSVFLIVASLHFEFAKSAVPKEIPAVTNLRTYLRFRTDHPNPDEGYGESIKWLKTQAEELGLNFTVVDLESELFAVCITWNGLDSSLKSILLNSHMDVVETDPSNWLYPPFDAHKDNQGNIYAAGSIDMKSKTIAELEAIRRLKDGSFQPLRTIHITILPDQEAGGLRGMKLFVQTDFFKNLNVGVDLDEGGSINLTTGNILVATSEKSAWKFNITAYGYSGPGSKLSNTAPQRLQVAINKLFEFRQKQYELYETGEIPLSKITSINLVRQGGGIGDDVIPSSVWAMFDMRIVVQPNWSFDDVEIMLNDIVNEAKMGSDDPNETVTIDYGLKSTEMGSTPTDESNPWWDVVQRVHRKITSFGHLRSYQYAAASDGRFVRELGIPVFGISPFPTRAESRPHEANEFVREFDFMKAIEIYRRMIKFFSSQPKLSTDEEVKE